MGAGGLHMVDYADSWGAQFHKGCQGLLKLVCQTVPGKLHYVRYSLLKMYTISQNFLVIA